MRIKLLAIFFSLLLGSCSLNKQVFISNNYDLKLAISSLESSKQLAIYNAGKLLPDINARINNQRAEQYLSEYTSTEK